MGEFVSDAVADILKMLTITDRILLDHLIGVDDCVEKVMDMLNLSSHVERQVVMVHGMGGIGKTTLANVIFNRISSRFDGSSFLADVRESLSIGVRGVERLQKKLLKDIFGKSNGEIGDSSDGMNEIQRRLRSRKVLIIFDNVNESSQLKKLIGNFDFFGPGTIVIVATRDRSVCEGLMQSSDIAYEMEGMKDDHALQLFSRHAFGGEGPPDDFACFNHFTMPREYASYMWDACGYYPKCGLDILQNRSLIKVLNFDDDDEDKIWKSLSLDDDDNDGDKYWMHDLIREMGREIVRSESPLHSPGMRSRLWDPEEAVNVVRQKQGTDQVPAIDLGCLREKHYFTGKDFAGMSNLRFLCLYYRAQLVGEFRDFWRKLLRLRWYVFWNLPSPTFFDMDSLVVLEISGLGITKNSIKDLVLSPFPGIPL